MKDGPKTLSAPLRIYWSLVPEAAGGIPGELAVSVGRELKGLKVFFVTLRLSSGKRQDILSVVESLKPAVRVTVSVCDEQSFPGAESVYAADGFDLMPDDLAGTSALLRLASTLGGKCPPLSFSLVPSRDNLGLIDEALGMAAAAGVRTFNLPNPDLTKAGAMAESFALDRQTRGELKRIIEGRIGPLGESAKLNVHDLFLHRELELPGIGARIEYAGCQAGDAIGFIDGGGLVYPCSTWPEPLGRLGVCSFTEVWASEVRHMLRELAHCLPEACEGCDEAADCKGGCIGLAHALGRPGGRDPGCEK